MSDSETIDVYNNQVDDYVALTEKLRPGAAIAAFISRIPAHGNILDLGCGPGNTAAYFQDQGYVVDAVDASAEMVRIATTKFGVNARRAEFLDIDAVAEYDGVWASFSLLHAQRHELPVILAALHRAIKPNGVFHLGMKLGEGSARDHLGRFYCYYPQDGLQSLLQDAGFSVLQAELGEGAGLAGTIDPWIEVLSEAR